MKVEFVDRSGSGAYEELFARSRNALAQQSPQWADTIAPLGPDAIFFAICRGPGGGVVGGMPLFHFESDLGAILTSVPQAGPLGGVLLADGSDSPSAADVYSTLISAARNLSRELNCVSLSVITNPISSDENLYALRNPADYVFRNFCQVIKLGGVFGPDDRLDAGGSKNNTRVRRNLAKARDSGIAVAWGSAADFDTWYELHTKRHQELQAPPLPKQLLANALARMGDRAGLAIARQDRKIVGGCLFIWAHEIVDVFIMSSDSEYMPQGVNYALTAFAIRHFESSGFRWFNWQSSKRGSGVYVFKQQWGSEERPYSFLTWTNPGFQALLGTPRDVLAEKYPWHYVAPFEAIEKRLTHGTFEKT